MRKVFPLIRKVFHLLLTLSKEISLRRVVNIVFIFSVGFVLLLGVTLFSLQMDLKPQLGKEWFIPPVEIYTDTENPVRLAQFYADHPIRRTLIKLEDVPVQCLQAITAIEDQRFLNHRGISLRSIGRAAVKNLLSLGVVEGASTVTQQLVKNYFLTSERTFRRKFKEILMAVLLELQLDKDKILENYLNVIYMGQSGAFQVRGFGEASLYYFDKNISNLNTAECATMAAIIKSPGNYHPVRFPRRSIERRDLVLQQMKSLKMITQLEYTQALLVPPPTQQNNYPTLPAPYAVQAIQKELKQLVGQNTGLKVYTSLDPPSQSRAQKAITTHIRQLESNNELIEKQKNEGHSLQAALISVDIKTGGVKALIGGRRFRDTQFNRVIMSQRQMGSLAKPIVYLTALNADNEKYTPLTLMPNELFTHTFGTEQSWSPKNYDKETSGPLPLFYTLKNSINIPSAQLGLEVGLDKVVKMAQRLGLQWPELPAITLGTVDTTPWDITQAYLTIARWGSHVPLHLINKVENLKGEVLYQRKLKPKKIMDPDAPGALVGMMVQTTRTGTARSVRGWREFRHHVAGKTGTTSNYKDAWFVGFTPHTLTLTWVGYDDNLSHGLTGSAGALPVWARFMKKQLKDEPVEDFEWPSALSSKTFSADEIESIIPTAKDFEKVPTELYFVD